MNDTEFNTTTADPTPARAERVTYVTPAVDILEDADGYTIAAEMPGITKDGVEINVENGELTFTGRRSSAASGSLIYGEARRADYRRTFDLDPAVDTEKVTARLEQGVLTIRLPKAQDKKPRRIAVSG
jgi:HSP20 family protein